MRRTERRGYRTAKAVELLVKVRRRTQNPVRRRAPKGACPMESRRRGAGCSQVGDKHLRSAASSSRRRSRTSGIGTSEPGGTDMLVTVESSRTLTRPDTGSVSNQRVHDLLIQLFALRQASESARLPTAMHLEHRTVGVAVEEGQNMSQKAVSPAFKEVLRSAFHQHKGSWQAIFF